MRLLLDTRVVLWELGGSRRVSDAAQEAIERAPDLLFSVVSFAEIGVRAAIGTLSVPRHLREHAWGSGVLILRLEADLGLAVADLPMHHRGPVDQLLIARARSEQLAIGTAGRRFRDYDVALVDAD